MSEERKEGHRRRRRSGRKRQRRRRQFLKVLAGAAVITPVAGYAGWQQWQDEQAVIRPGTSDDVAYSGHFLGCAVSGSTPSNWLYKTAYAQRFKAERSGKVLRLRWWNKFDERPGYHTGDGGIIQIELCADDGTGQPGSEVLARSKEIEAPVSLGAFPLIALSPAPSLEKGQIYHIVYRQLAPERGTISVNECLTYVPDWPLAPYYGDWLASLRPDGESWQVRPGHYPVFELHYADDIVKGQGYIMGYRKARRAIAGPKTVRQNFIIPDGDVELVAVHLRLYRTQERGKNLSLRLEHDDGMPIEVLSILESEIGTDPFHDARASQADGRAIGWVRKSFARPYRLEHKKLYRIALSAPKEAAYHIQPVQDGHSSGWGFGEDKLTRGNVRAEFSHDGGLLWQGLSMFDKHDRRDMDFPILLEFG